MPAERLTPKDGQPDDEEQEPPVHSAVTLRPATPFPFSPSTTPDPVVTHLDAPAAEDGAKAPGPASSGVVPTAPASRLNLAALAPLPPLVIGFTARPNGGTLVTGGGCNSRFDDRTAYFAHLATLIGQEIGMEALRELHVVGKALRIGHYVNRDATYLSVLANVDCDVADVAQRVFRT